MSYNNQKSPKQNRGYFGIGIESPKTKLNVGTLWRSAHSMGADFIFTIGCRYQKQSSDTTKAWRNIPLYHYETLNDFQNNVPYDCRIIGTETENHKYKLSNFCHPDRCIYLLGAEDVGLSRQAIDICQSIVKIPHCNQCLNVATAGAIVMYDRITKNDIRSRVRIP